MAEQTEQMEKRGITPVAMDKEPPQENSAMGLVNDTLQEVSAAEVLMDTERNGVQWMSPWKTPDAIPMPGS